MDPYEIEFIGENRIVSIIPNFTYDKIYLLCGEFGPFRAGLPMNVPLWLALMLKQKQKCRMVPPDWMDIEILENIKKQERDSKIIDNIPIDLDAICTKIAKNGIRICNKGLTVVGETLLQLPSSCLLFTKMPNEHYMVEAKLILGAAPEDVPRAAEIKTIIKDIWDIRMSKLRTSMDALMKSGGSYGRLDHLTMMEINSVKPLLPEAMDELYRIQMMAAKNIPNSSLNTSTFSQSGSSQNL